MVFQKVCGSFEPLSNHISNSSGIYTLKIDYDEETRAKNRGRIAH